MAAVPNSIAIGGNATIPSNPVDKKDIKEKSEQDMEKLKSAFSASSLDKIKYSKKPICLSKEYQEIITSEFAKMNNMILWTDGLLIPVNLDEEMQLEKKFTREKLACVQERLSTPLNSLIVCEIDNIVGKGVFLDLNASSIPKGTVIGIYAGEFKMNQPVCSSYAMSLSDVNCIYDIICNPHVDGKCIGNITRFIQDLPTESELQSTNLPKDILSNIATQNLTLKSTLYNGYPIRYLITTREIKPGEQLGFSYGSYYWKGKVTQRRVFNMEGSVIGRFFSNDEINLDESICHTIADSPKSKHLTQKSLMFKWVSEKLVNQKQSDLIKRNIEKTILLEIEKYFQNPTNYPICQSNPLNVCIRESLKHVVRKY